MGGLKTMKKFITLGLLLVLNAAVVFASSIITVKEDLIYKSFIGTIVPEDYVEPFYENTKNNITIGIELLAIGQKETEWKMNDDGTWPVCRNRNKEGKVVSTDHGPLQLNSLNFGPFEKMFGEGLEEYKDDVDIYRMCLCIKYYQDIRGRSGTYNAFREYNGGYLYYKKSVTKDYADRASVYNNQFSKEYYTYKRTEMARIEQEEIKKLLSKKILKDFAFLLKGMERRELSKAPIRGLDKKFYVKREDPCRFLIA